MEGGTKIYVKFIRKKLRKLLIILIKNLNVMKNEKVKQILESKTSITSEQVEILKSEFQTQEENLERSNLWKKTLGGTSVILLVALIVVILCSKCSGDKMVKENNDLKVANYELFIENFDLGKENDSLKKELSEVKYERDSLEAENEILRERINYAENLKPILLVTKITRHVERKQIIEVDAVMAPKSSKYSSHVSFEHELCNYDSIKFENDTLKMKLEFGKEVLDLALNSLNQIMNDSVEVVMTKENPDNSWELLRSRAAYQDMLDMPVNPVIEGSHVFTEYWDNPYRIKKEKSFRNALILTGVSGGLYGLTEAMGHPVFRDYPADNSVAQRKSNTIKGLRIGAGVVGAVAVFEFARTWHFHNMEGEYIISPTEVGVSINLSSIK